MKNLESLVAELENKISLQETMNEKVSASPVGWHIEHTLLTMDAIIGALKKSDPKNYKRTFSAVKLIVFTFNKIPRGRGKSPDVVTPGNYHTADSLTTHAGITKKNIEQLRSLAPNNHFEHPYFGKLRQKEAIKFIRIHTAHHLAIINDIIGKQGAR